MLAVTGINTRTSVPPPLAEPPRGDRPAVGSAPPCSQVPRSPSVWRPGNRTPDEQSLSRSQVRLRELASRLFRAHKDERRRLAREFHDDFSQRMAATSIQLGSLDKRFPDLPAEVRRELALVQEQVVELSDDLRRVSHELHPAALEQLGLESALRAHCARLTEHDPLARSNASACLRSVMSRCAPIATVGLPSAVAITRPRLSQSRCDPSLHVTRHSQLNVWPASIARDTSARTRSTSSGW